MLATPNRVSCWNLHKLKRGRQESDQAVAVVAALCVKNRATIEKFMMLLDGLDSHPSIGESLLCKCKVSSGCCSDKNSCGLMF